MTVISSACGEPAARSAAEIASTTTCLRQRHRRRHCHVQRQHHQRDRHTRRIYRQLDQRGRPDVQPLRRDRPGRPVRRRRVDIDNVVGATEAVGDQLIVDDAGPSVGNIVNSTVQFTTGATTGNVAMLDVPRTDGQSSLEITDFTASLTLLGKTIEGRSMPPTPRSIFRGPQQQQHPRWHRRSLVHAVDLGGCDWHSTTSMSSTRRRRRRRSTSTICLRQQHVRVGGGLAGRAGAVRFRQGHRAQGSGKAPTPAT